MATQYKTKAILVDPFYAIVKISIEIPQDQRNLAEAMGITEEEQNNLVGQTLQTFISLLGNSDEI